MLEGLKTRNVAIGITVAGLLIGLIWFAESGGLVGGGKKDEFYLAGIDGREGYCAAASESRGVGNMPPGVVGMVFEPHAGPLSATVNFPSGDMGIRSFTVIRDKEPFLTYVNKKPRMC